MSEAAPTEKTGPALRGEDSLLFCPGRVGEGVTADEHLRVRLEVGVHGLGAEVEAVRPAVEERDVEATTEPILFVSVRLPADAEQIGPLRALRNPTQ